MFGLLLAGFSLVSYQVLARRLDADVTERLTQLTDGLHGYLRFGEDTASVEFDESDNDQAVFVQEATRYYQVYDVATGRLVAASNVRWPELCGRGAISFTSNCPSVLTKNSTHRMSM